MKRIEGYTKGPWRWGAEDSCSCGGTPLECDGTDPVLVIYESHGGGAMPNPADAELIASAPETYERCVALEEENGRMRGQIAEAVAILESGTKYEKMHLVGILKDGLPKGKPK